MANKIIHKRSFTTGSIPTTSSLDVGEIALNVPDGKMYLHKSGSNGQSIESTITSNSTASIGILTMSGSLILSGSTDINSGSVFDVSADNISFDFDSLSFSGSAEITGSLVVTGGITGSFTGSYVGDGAGLYNIPAGGIVGLNLSQIASGSVSASISPSAGLQVNTNVTAPAFTGSFTGSFTGDGSQLTGIVSSKWSGSNPITRQSDVEITGSFDVAGQTTLSTTGSGTLKLQGSGSSQPIFTVQGSSGELFSITDNLSGSLFAVNNISGLPIFEVFSDDKIIQGDYVAPMLTTTVKNTVSSIGAFTVYELPTSSYDGAFFEYVAKSGSDARAGQIMSLWSGSQVNFTETTTTDFGDTSGLSFIVTVTGSNFALTGSVTTANWTIKTIVRSI